MGKIDTSGWKEFSVCELFGKSRLGKYHCPESLVESETGYPYICASNQNNGVNQKMSLVSGDDVRPTPQNIISWGKQCPYFTFHEEPCVTGQGVYYIVVPEYIPRKAIRYVITVLQSAVEGKFGYSDCFIGSSMDDLSIKLPATPNGAPDWTYMESYMANLESKVAESLTMLQAAKDAEKKKVDTREWGEFRVGELFKTQMKGKKNQVPTGANVPMQDMIKDGSTPRITVTGVNNGVFGLYDYCGKNSTEYRVFRNFISVSFLGTVFYQEGEATLDMKVHCLQPNHITLNKYTGNFLVSAIKASLRESSYSDQISSTILPEMTIMLPKDKTGQPDWAYMEEYMRKVEERVKVTMEKYEMTVNEVAL